MSRKSWRELTGSGDYNTSNYTHVDGSMYQGEKAAFADNISGGYSMDDNWSCSSQQGSK